MDPIQEDGDVPQEVLKRATDALWAQLIPLIESLCQQQLEHAKAFQRELDRATPKSRVGPALARGAQYEPPTQTKG